jgi:hypothetical protein
MVEVPSCGQGLAEHAEIPAKMGELLASLAENLEAHLPSIDVRDEAGRQERDAYDSLIRRYREIAERIGAAASEMAGYRDLPVARHHEEAFADERIGRAFEQLVRMEGELAALLKRAHARDKELLDQMLGTISGEAPGPAHPEAQP